jgi:HEAT repeat protein
MDKATAEQHFDQAVTLAAQGRYDQALPILEKLLRHFPRESKLLYARALCLSRLGRYAESGQLLEYLISEFNHEGARQLLALHRTTQASQQAEAGDDASAWVSRLVWSIKMFGKILRAIGRFLRYCLAVGNLRSNRQSVRVRAARVLADMGHPGAVRHLHRAFLDARDKEFRLAVAKSLVLLGDCEPVDTYAGELDGEYSSDRIAAARALGEIGAPCAIEPLIELLASNDASLRQQAAVSLAQLGEPKWLDIVGGDRHYVDGLRSCGDLRAIKALIAFIKNARWSSDDVLKEFARVPDAIGPLIAALGNDDNRVCRAAVQALGESGDSRAVDPLINVLKDTPGLRQVTAYALGNLGDLRALDALCGALRDPDSYVSKAAISSLMRLGDSRSVEPLIGALGHASPIVRKEAAEALAKFGELNWQSLIKGDEGDLARLSVCDEGSRTLESFVTALQDGKLEIRRIATFALIRIATTHPECMDRVREFREVIGRPHEDKIISASNDCNGHSDQGIGMKLPF